MKPRSRASRTTLSMSSGSDIEVWPMVSGPVHDALVPMTTTSLVLISTPAETLATEE